MTFGIEAVMFGHKDITQSDKHWLAEINHRCGRWVGHIFQSLKKSGAGSFDIYCVLSSSKCHFLLGLKTITRL
jgi:hypothetical protein